MTNATQPVQTPHWHVAARGRLACSLERTGKWAEAHSRLVLVLFLALYLGAELGYSLAAPLWHDELFTFWLAQAPSTASMLARVRLVDLNPPLSYLLARLSLKLFGVGTLQCRLPEIAAFALALVCTARFVQRRAGAAWGLCAAAFLFASRAGELVYQARPYGLLLGTGALALLFWQRCHRRPDLVASGDAVGLGLALTALLLTHVFGLFCWAALLAAEATRVLQQRRVHIPAAIALLAPLLALFCSIPLMRNHASSAFPLAFQPTGNDVFLFYMGHVDRELIAIWLAAFVLVAVGGRSWLRGGTPLGLTAPEWVAIAGLVAAPLVLIGYLMFAHGAFFDRYGVMACLGTCTLFALLFRSWTGGRPAAAYLVAGIALLITGRLPDALIATAQGHIFRHTEPVVAPLPTALLRDHSLPLVAASGLTFVEMQRREPAALLARTVYLTDTAAALTYAHATIFEGMPQEARLFPFHSAVVPYHQFLSAHPVFYVLGTYDYPEDWLLRALQHDGARLTVLGRVEGSYKDHELYQVESPVTAARYDQAHARAAH